MSAMVSFITAPWMRYRNKHTAKRLAFAALLAPVQESSVRAGFDAPVPSARTRIGCGTLGIVRVQDLVSRFLVQLSASTSALNIFQKRPACHFDYLNVRSESS